MARAGFGYGRFGHFQWGTYDWGEYHLWWSVPEVVRYLDKDYGDAYRKFVNSVSKLFNEQKLFVSNIETIRDPLKIRVDLIGTLMKQHGLIIDEYIYDRVKRSLLEYVVKINKNKGTLNLFEFVSKLYGFSSVEVVPLWEVADGKGEIEGKFTDDLPTAIAFFDDISGNDAYYEGTPLDIIPLDFEKRFWGDEAENFYHSHFKDNWSIGHPADGELNPEFQGELENLSFVNLYTIDRFLPKYAKASVLLVKVTSPLLIFGVYDVNRAFLSLKALFERIKPAHVRLIWQLSIGGLSQLAYKYIVASAYGDNNLRIYNISTKSEMSWSPIVTKHNGPRGMAIDETKQLLFVVTSSGYLEVYDISKYPFVFINDFYVGNLSPLDIVCLPSKNLVFISVDTTSYVVVVDYSNLSNIIHVVGSPYAVASMGTSPAFLSISPDGDYLCIGITPGNNGIKVFDLTGFPDIAMEEIEGSPYNIDAEVRVGVWDDSKKILWAVRYTAGADHEIDGLDYQSIPFIELEGYPRDIVTGTVDTVASGIIDGNGYLVVSDNSSGSIVSINIDDLADPFIEDIVFVGNNSVKMDYNSVTKKLYVACSGSDRVAIVNASSIPYTVEDNLVNIDGCFDVKLVKG